jgi:hypothetical protein
VLTDQIYGVLGTTVTFVGLGLAAYHREQILRAIARGIRPGASRNEQDAAEQALGENQGTILDRTLPAVAGLMDDGHDIASRNLDSMRARVRARRGSDGSRHSSNQASQQSQQGGQQRRGSIGSQQGGHHGSLSRRSSMRPSQESDRSYGHGQGNLMSNWYAQPIPQPAPTRRPHGGNGDSRSNQQRPRSRSRRRDADDDDAPRGDQQRRRSRSRRRGADDDYDPRGTQQRRRSRSRRRDADDDDEPRGNQGRRRSRSHSQTPERHRRNRSRRRSQSSSRRPGDIDGGYEMQDYGKRHTKKRDHDRDDPAAGGLRRRGTEHGDRHMRLDFE